MLGLIAVIGIVAYVCSRYGTEAGAVALIVAAVFLVWLGVSCERDAWRAHRNCVEYWRDGHGRC